MQAQAPKQVPVLVLKELAQEEELAQGEVQEVVVVSERGQDHGF